jgi:hypothetical protein
MPLLVTSTSHCCNPVALTVTEWISKPLKWMQSLHQSTWAHDSLCDDKSSEGEQLSMRQIL